MFLAESFITGRNFRFADQIFESILVRVIV